MRFFAYEYTCATESGRDALSEHLRLEGIAMLRAVLEDLHRIPSVTTATLVGDNCSAAVEAHAVHRIHADDERAAFCKLAAAADFTLVIAPECSDILSTRCAWVEEAGGELLGPMVEAVRLTGDKLALAQHLCRRGVPTPVCVSASRRVGPADFPAVWKPRYGAGSTATFYCGSRADCRRAEEAARQECWEGEAILQRYVPGRPASVAVLTGPAQSIALMPAEQHLSADGRFRYFGGKVPVAAPLVERAQRLALSAVATVRGMRGYVGVDLVLGDADDGSQDYVIEVNPRLTTSYVGLRKLTDANLMALLLDVATGKPVAPPVWKSGSVAFQANGTIAPLLQ